jgi:negative regulator of sigma E activity
MLKTLLCKNILAKSKEVKTRWSNSQKLTIWQNLIKKKGYGSRRTVLVVAEAAVAVAVVVINHYNYSTHKVFCHFLITIHC